VHDGKVIAAARAASSAMRIGSGSGNIARDYRSPANASPL
jgi:hypothetical protein